MVILIEDIIVANLKDDGKGLLNLLMEIGAIPKRFECPKCLTEMTIRRDSERFKWQCNASIQRGHKKAKRCAYSKSVMSETMFQNTHLSLKQISMFVLMWVRKCGLLFIETETKISHKHCVEWSAFCRDIVFDLMMEKQQPLGGDGKTVEIDESKFGKRKYNRGKRVDGQWVFGLIERESGRVVLVPVKKRDAATLVPLIKKWVLPGTKIISDKWGAYNSLGSEGFTHETVNHSKYFTDPITGANTNRIESTWRAAKDKFESSSRRKHSFSGYLAKYSFIKYCSMNNLDPFVVFMQHAAVFCTPPETSLSTPLDQSSHHPSDDDHDDDNDEEDDEDEDLEF